jgi:hypothetical protein
MIEKAEKAAEATHSRRISSAIGMSALCQKHPAAS